jgi:hypothetical protein
MAEPDFRSGTSVGLGFGVATTSGQPDESVKYKRKDCPVCKGKGKYLSGDGISWVDCGYCEAEGKTAEQLQIEELQYKNIDLQHQLAEKEKVVAEAKVAPNTNLLTALVVNVPAEAEVFLGRNEKKMKEGGTSRVFFSSNMTHPWVDYKVVAVYKGERKEQLIDVYPGQNIAVTFNFDEVETTNLPVEAAPEPAKAEAPLPAKEKDMFEETTTAPPSPTGVAKAKGQKCCPDCKCGDDCTCSYPGECLVKAHDGQDVIMYDIVRSCNRRNGTCVEVKKPVRRYSANKPMQVIQ